MTTDLSIGRADGGHDVHYYTYTTCRLLYDVVLEESADDSSLSIIFTFSSFVATKPFASFRRLHPKCRNEREMYILHKHFLILYLPLRGVYQCRRKRTLMAGISVHGCKKRQEGKVSGT